ncbi:nuclear mitotic apparatus protein 1-like isoform X2 [Python bivittatus]|uniref:Nuclear mitotic apparatus protein 1-like isoform X2 n=1 Tax=Python bivittatus TaxID=176946 RepID=A0A9F3W1F7_PYTBI|nr:nuclear mitotic apparatus protein 1-like isoform X2 [Python bivittatus]
MRARNRKGGRRGCVGAIHRQDRVGSQVLKRACPVFLAQVNALSVDWEQRHQQLKTEQEKVVELEAQIKLLNAKQEEAMASLQADMLHAAAQIQEKEGLAEQLRAEVASLEERVRVACQEAAENAAELEKGAHEARLALEATLQQLTREEAVTQTLPAGQDTLPLPLCEQFLRGQDTEWPGRSEGAEAAADAPPSTEAPDTPSPGGLQEEVSRFT